MTDYQEQVEILQVKNDRLMAALLDARNRIIEFHVDIRRLESARQSNRRQVLANRAHLNRIGRALRSEKR